MPGRNLLAQDPPRGSKSTGLRASCCSNKWAGVGQQKGSAEYWKKTWNVGLPCNTFESHHCFVLLKQSLHERFHRFAEQLGLEGTSGSTQHSVPSTMSRWLLKTSEEETPQPFQATCATHTAQKCFLTFRRNLPCVSLCPSLLAHLWASLNKAWIHPLCILTSGIWTYGH